MAAVVNERRKDTVEQRKEGGGGKGTMMKLLLFFFYRRNGNLFSHFSERRAGQCSLFFLLFLCWFSLQPFFCGRRKMTIKGGR